MYLKSRVIRLDPHGEALRRRINEDIRRVLAEIKKGGK